MCERGGGGGGRTARLISTNPATEFPLAANPSPCLHTTTLHPPAPALVVVGFLAVKPVLGPAAASTTPAPPPPGAGEVSVPPPMGVVVVGEEAMAP